LNKLIVCEKPSVAKSIAAVLEANERKDGFFIGNGNIVSWCLGHLLELAAPDAYGTQYAKWRYEDLPIIPQEWKHVPAKDKAAQLKILKDLMNRTDIDCVVNACDAGREGELIFRLVYEYAKCGKPIKRLWISSMEDAAIKAGFASLKNGAEYDNLYATASCRERADWLIGMNITRLMSVLYGTVLNTGRVQSPTLAMLVKREADIASFAVETFYTPVISCPGFIASGERTKDRQAAEAVRNACEGKAAAVRTVVRQKKTESPPKLYDLTALQRDANRLYGYTAQQTLDYAQALYEKKLITYPRTDSRYLTDGMGETAKTVIAGIYKFLRHGVSHDTPDLGRIMDSGKVGDHHALIPTLESVVPDMAVMPDSEFRVWSLIAARMVCAVAPAHVYESITATLECGGYEFAAKGKTIIVGGWKEIDETAPDWLDVRNGNLDDESAPLPIIVEGDTYYIFEAAVKNGKTTPPKHYTEDTLLSAMENAGADDMPDDAERKGLGTPATRAAIIEKIIKAGFVERQKKNLIPTGKGKNLIAVLPEALTSVKLTAEWENRLQLVERGELSECVFMDGIAEFTKSIVVSNSAPKPEFMSLFPESKRQAAESLGVCPRCGSPVREGARGFFCDSRTCGFKIWKESKFWTAKKKPLTASIVAALLKDGRVALKGLYSEKTGKKYDATVVLADTGDGFVNFKMDF